MKKKENKAAKNETVKSIATYRKKRKRKRIFKAFFFLLLAVGLSYAGLRGYQYFSGNDSFGDSSGGFPVALKGDNLIECETIDNHLVLLTDKNLLIYSKSGKEKQELNHGYFNPSIDCNQRWCLLFDIGSTQCKLVGTSGVALEKTTENKIIFGKVASNGNIALVTEDEHYQCRLTIYDKKGKELFRWFSAEGIVTALCFNSSENGCVVSTMNTENGIPTSTIYGLSFSKTNELYHTSVSNVLAVDVLQVGNRIHLVGDNQLIVFDTKGNQLQTTSYPNSLKQVLDKSSSYTILLLGEDIKSSNSILVLDANGQKVSEKDFNETVRKIACDNRHVLALTKEQILLFDVKLNDKKSYDNKSGATYIAILDSSGYDVNSNQIEKFSI